MTTRATYYSYNSQNQGYPKSFTAYGACDCTVSGVTNYDVLANTSLFSNITNGNELVVRVYGGNVSIKFNSDTNDVITMSDGESFTFQNLLINNIYITGTAVVKFTMLGYN